MPAQRMRLMSPSAQVLLSVGGAIAGAMHATAHGVYGPLERHRDRRLFRPMRIDRAHDTTSSKPLI